MKKIITTLLVFLLALSIVNAFGMGQTWEGSRITMDKGETRIFNIELQNLASSSENLTVKAEIIKGNEIASISQETYSLPLGKTLQVPVKVTIPRDFETGNIIRIEFQARTMAEGGSEMITAGTGSSWAWEIETSSKTRYASLINILLVIIIIILAIIVFIILKRKQKNKK